MGSKWSNKIATSTWQIGGNTYQNIYNVSIKSTYQNEIVSPAKSTTYNAKIGLMYVSDYGYAASPENWTTTLNSYNNSNSINNNWMFMKWYDWTISRSSDDAKYVFNINHTGDVSISNVSVGARRTVRPSFYLNTNVVMNGGNGTISDPYRIA